jgi:hypothetical protein
VRIMRRAGLLDHIERSEQILGRWWPHSGMVPGITRTVWHGPERPIFGGSGDERRRLDVASLLRSLALSSNGRVVDNA